MNTARVSSFAIRSSSRWRWRVSTSAKPWCFSGGGRSDLASNVKSSSLRESSPRRVRKTVPSAPIRSPRSSCSSRAIRSSPSTSTRACSWIRPERSTTSRNAALPWPRRAASRPAIRARTSVSAPGGRSSCGAFTSAIGCTPGNACGNGSTPAARSSSSLRRRSIRTCGRSSSVMRRLSDADLGDGQLALALRRGHGDRVALLATDQRLADGRLVRQPLVRRVGLGGADDRVLEALALLVLAGHQRADADDVVVELGRVDHLRGAELVLELRDPRLEHRLLVLGVVVLGVLGDVAELARLLDALRDLAAAGDGEVLDLLLELLESFGGEDDVLLHASSLGSRDLCKTTARV